MVTKRDNQVFFCLQEEGDGALPRRHLKALVFPDVTLRSMQRAMQRLTEKDYVERATTHYQRLTNPKSEPWYWLGHKGILAVAEQMGLEDLFYPKTANENQFRILERQLRAQELRWLRELPSIGKLEHECRVLDFKFKLKRDASQLPHVSLDWVNESAFRSPEMDKVKYSTRNQDGQFVEQERGVCPDGFCLIEDHQRKQKGEPHKLHLLVEADMGTHPVQSRFALQKAAPYAAYIGSPPFRARFGSDATVADWLIVTSGKRRMEHLIKQTILTAGKRARFFLFCTWQQALDPKINLLIDPVWARPKPHGGIKKWSLLTGKLG